MGAGRKRQTRTAGASMHGIALQTGTASTLKLAPTNSWATWQLYLCPLTSIYGNPMQTDKIPFSKDERGA